jgi:cell division protein FtsQ
MSRREDRTQRRVVVVRHTRPPAAGRFARRPGPERRSNGGPEGSMGADRRVAEVRADGWRAKLPAALQRPLAWQAPVAGRAVAGAGKAAASATRSLRDRLQRGLPQTLVGRVLAAVAAIALFTGATWTTTRSALLDVDHIEVSGGLLVTPGQATTGAGLHRGQPMVSVDTAAAERRLRRLPWVKTALVERAFPNTVRIHLTERVAAATAARPGGWVLLDSGGRVLAERPDRAGDLPEVIGAGAAPVPGAPLTAARPALDVVAALPEAVRRQVTSATLDGESVTLRTGVREIRVGPPTQLAAKVAALSVLLERVGSRSVAILDIRVPQAPVVVPTAPTPATSTPAPGRGATAPVSPGKPRD